MAASPPTEQHEHRFRAAKACRRCNQRRVKCDALNHGIPCTRCQQADNSDCVLIKSKRGTYTRKKAKLDHAALNMLPTESETTATFQAPAVLPSPPEQSQSSVNHSSYDNESIATETPPTVRVENQSKHPSAGRDLLHMNPDLSPIFQAPMPATPANSNLDSPESNLTEASVSSYRELSWATMFEHFLDSRRRDRKDVIDKCSITYLGESFPLALVLGDLKEGGKLRLHHPGPPLDDSQSRVELSNQQVHPSHMLPEDIDYLEAKKAFDFPATETLVPLISTFLDRVFPVYPIVNRQEFLTQYKDKKIPWILLHSLCFVSATYCPISILHRAGFAGRKQARFSYYRKAKALFDTGYESNKIVILQSVILLTFWGGGPNNYWNFYAWIGTGVTVAETLGIHRSLAGTNMRSRDRSLLKRLWWILVIRDASSAALVGRPFKINMDHSDTENLTPEDFEHDGESPEFAKHPLRPVFGLYQIHISKLSLILREIVMSRFDPGRKTNTTANMDELLRTWRQDLPPELQWSEHSTNLNVLATTLSILYNHHLILAHLGQPTTTTMAALGSAAKVQRIPEAAAQRIAAVACSIVTRSQVLLMPHESFHGLFLAEVVFYTQMKNPDPMMAQLGRAALDNCQMALHDAREAWDPAPWVMNLFNNLIRNLKEDSSNSEIDLLADPFGEGCPSMDDGITAVRGAGQDGGDFDPWQANPLLSNLFDLSYDSNGFQNPEFFFQPSLATAV